MTDVELMHRANLYAGESVHSTDDVRVQARAREVARAFVIGYAAGLEDGIENNRYRRTK